MTDKIQSMTIILMTTIMLTGGIVPYSFANETEHDYEDQCEVPHEFEVMYEGPSNAEVEIYKKTKQAKESTRMLKDFPGQTFNSGDYITLHAHDDLDQDKINARTTYKIMHGSSWEIISINTSCKKPIAVGDVYEKGDVKLTIMHGKDKHGDDVLYEEYRVETTNTVQECSGEDKVLLDFEAGLEHGSNQESIQAYLSNLGLANLQIEYSADSNGPVNNPGAIYDSRYEGPPQGKDPDLEDPVPNPPDVGNMLIIQEHDDGSDDDGVWDHPDDESSGGSHTISFKDAQGAPIGVGILSWKNIDLEGGNEDNVFRVNGGSSMELTSTGNDAWTIQSPADLTDVQEIIYDLDASGGITDICVQIPTAPILTGSITIHKVVVAEDPSDVFTFDLEPGTMTSPPIGNDGTHTFSDLAPGMYTLTEDFVSSEYSVDITCEMNDGADIVFPMTEGEVEITIEAGEDPICEFTNTEKNPATLTIKKALTNDNNGDATVDDFQVTVWNLGDDGLPDTGDESIFTQVNFDQTISSITVNPPAGTYNITEAITDNTVVASYTTVLVAGDTACPAMEGSPFTLSDGQEITCIIYNDDDFIPGGVPGPKPTVTLTVDVADERIVVPAEGFNYQIGTNSNVFLADGETSAQIDIDANTATLITQINALDRFPSKIKGDGNCPEVLAGTITLSSGQNIECTMFYGIEVEPGVIFWFNTLEVDTTFGIPLDQTGDTCANLGIQPCVELNPDLGTYMVVDDHLQNPTTVILWSILADFGDDRGNGGCVLSGIDIHTPTTENGFYLDCSEPERGIFHFNYALIEADINAMG